MGELSSLDDMSFSMTSIKFYSDRGYRFSIFRNNLRVLTGETDRKGRLYSAEDIKALEAKLALNS